LVAKLGKLYTPRGCDFFVFPRATSWQLPDFAVGRPGWDNWMIYRARALGMPVIDATEAVTVVHQNHNYAHIPQAKAGSPWNGPEAERNGELVGDLERVFTFADANWRLSPRGLRPNLSSAHRARYKETLPILYPELQQYQHSLQDWSAFISLGSIAPFSWRPFINALRRRRLLKRLALSSLHLRPDRYLRAFSRLVPR
jgi:hypothetical protein